MDRISLLASGCTAIVVVFALLTPAQFVSAFSLDYWIPGRSVSTVVEANLPAAKPISHRSVETTPARHPLAAAAFFVPDIPVLSQKTDVVVVKVEPRKPAPRVTVVKDTSFLYSLNHSGSAVVTTLPKGEIVEPQMQVNDAGQEWSYVTASALHVSGYLPSDWLELK